MNTAQWQKPALFIYRDGRIKHTGQVFDMPTVVEWEQWPMYSCVPATTTTDDPLGSFPNLKRYFRFIGEAGPYAVYAEI